MSRLEALADPIRLRIVRHLARRPGASLPELAEAAGVHVNTVRPHASALQAAAVIERHTAAPAGRGRPRLGYRLAAAWSPPTSDFRGLAELLAAALVRADPSREELRDLGEEWGTFVHGRPGRRDGATQLPAALERLGFDARVEHGKVELASCPCTRVSPDRPELVCDLAAAVAAGVLRASGSGMTIGARAHDPARRACSLTLGRAARSR